MSIRSSIPWYCRMAGKLVLSRVPASYSIWKKLGIFEHGSMHDPAYAYAVFRAHFDRSQFPRRDGGFVALELGPGDSLASCVVAAAYGASHYYGVDSGRFATGDIGPYREMADYLKSRGLEAPNVGDSRCLSDVLATCRSSYLTDGLAALKSIPDAAVDFVWSHAVLEHVRRRDFYETMVELRRVLSPGGCCSHQVDLKDHLGGGINNMRFSSHFWEQEWVVRSGFYTNRLKISEIHQLFKRAGFEVEHESVSKYERLPMPRNLLAPEFRELADEDLLVSGFSVVLR